MLLWVYPHGSLDDRINYDVEIEADHRGVRIMARAARYNSTQQSQIGSVGRQLQRAEGLALVTLGTTAHSPDRVFREDALPIRAVVVIVVDVAVARLAAFRCDRVVRRYLGHAGSVFVD